MTKYLITSNLSRQNTLNEILQDHTNVADIFNSSLFTLFVTKIEV